jgi:hypothetical protein
MENTDIESCRQPDRFYRWGAKPHRRSPISPEEDWGYVVQSVEARESCEDWSHEVKSHYDSERRILEIFEGPSKPGEGTYLRIQAERLRPAFNTLAEQWRRETKFLSSLDEKVLHPAYQSIIAMGERAVPLVLEELDARHGHWFWALHFMTGVDPIPEGANIEKARFAWLEWGKEQGLLLK